MSWHLSLAGILRALCARVCLALPYRSPKRYPYKDRPYYIHKTHAVLVTRQAEAGAAGRQGPGPTTPPRVSSLGAARTALLNYTGGGSSTFCFVCAGVQNRKGKLSDVGYLV